MYKCNKCKSKFPLLKFELIRLPIIYANVIGVCPECGSTDFVNMDAPESPKVNSNTSQFDGDTLNAIKYRQNISGRKHKFIVR